MLDCFQQFDQLLDLADVHGVSVALVWWAWLEPRQGGAQREFIALGTQPADHAHRDVGEIGVGAEGLAGMDVGQVHLDEGDGHRQQGIAQGDAGMGEGRRVDEDEADALGCRAWWMASIRTCSALLWMNARRWPAASAPGLAAVAWMSARVSRP